MYQRVMFGPVTKQENKGLKDLSMREAIILAPLIILFVLMGFFPGPILRRTEPSVQKLILQVNGSNPHDVTLNGAHDAR